MVATPTLAGSGVYGAVVPAVVGVAEAVSGGAGEVVAVAERVPEPIPCAGTTIVTGVGAALLPPPEIPGELDTPDELHVSPPPGVEVHVWLPNLP